MSSSTSSDSVDPVVLLLDGLIAGVDLDDLHARVGACFAYGSRLDARVLLDLAASAFLACGASSADPLKFNEFELRYLPDSVVRGNTAHQKRRYALTAAILISSGVEPEDTSWWRANDLWSHAFDAAVTFVRAASERRQLPMAAICAALREPT